MESKKKPANEINADIIALMKEERKKDPRSFSRKIFDSIIHKLKVMSERFSPMN